MNGSQSSAALSGGYPHAIRLRGPWDYRPLARTALLADGSSREEPGDLPPAGRAILPADWGETLGPSFFGSVRYRRSFNRPTGLEAHERVWLVCEGVDARGHVSLNGTALGAVRGYALRSSFDVTDLVLSRNELAIDVELPRAPQGYPFLLRPGREACPGGPMAETRLEIRASQSIEDLSIHVAEESAGPILHVRGRVVGTGVVEGLAIVVVGDSKELLHEVLDSPDFCLTRQVDSFERWSPSSPAVMPLSIWLLGPHGAAWETRLDTATSIVAWNPGENRLEAAGGPIVWPARIWRPEGNDVERLQSVGEPPSRQSLGPIGVAQILSESAYRLFDRAGQVVVQILPASWAHEVSGRLAHHPSIAAWAIVSDHGPAPATTELAMEIAEEPAKLAGKPCVRLRLNGHS